MLTFETKVDTEKKIVFTKLSGELANEEEVNRVVDQFLSEVDSHKWFSLIIDISELDMPGLQAYSLLGKLGKDKLDEAVKNLKKIAIVDNGKVTDLMSAFFMKPPQNMFFEDLNSAIEFICQI
jgi:hypothetical protein